MHRKERRLTIIPITYSDLPQSESNLKCDLVTHYFSTCFSRVPQLTPISVLVTIGNSFYRCNSKTMTKVFAMSCNMESGHRKKQRNIRIRNYKRNDLAISYDKSGDVMY